MKLLYKPILVSDFQTTDFSLCDNESPENQNWKFWQIWHNYDNLKKGEKKKIFCVNLALIEKKQHSRLIPNDILLHVLIINMGNILWYPHKSLIYNSTCTILSFIRLPAQNVQEFWSYP